MKFPTRSSLNSKGAELVSAKLFNINPEGKSECSGFKQKITYLSTLLVHLFTYFCLQKSWPLLRDISLT